MHHRHLLRPAAAVKALLVLLLALGAAPRRAEGKIVHLLPKPQRLTAHTNVAPFALGRPVRLTDPTANASLRRFLDEAGCRVRRRARACVSVRLVDHIDGAYDYPLAGYPDEAYTLSIRPDSIRITATTPTGVTRAAQTLAQLALDEAPHKLGDARPDGADARHHLGDARPHALEALDMVDWPAFKLRGFMHDVGRSYIPIEVLKQHIDLLARFKFNTFHWHLTENQAWRFEVKAYPQLTSARAMTRHAGRYYTQAECTALEQYAAERGVTVIPEIDMPGHSAAFERAMGHSMQTDSGVAELRVILREVAAAFPRAPYIHIGADEKPITYPGFLRAMTDAVHALGRKVVVWNPIHGVRITPELGVDMTQMWSTAGRKVDGIPNIDCRYNYTNHFDLFADVVGIYKSNIYYQSQGSADVAGFITAPWNDRLLPTTADIVRQNNFWACCLASVERGWLGGGRQYIEQGGTTLVPGSPELKEFADWERRFLFYKHHTLKGQPIAYVRQTDVLWRVSEAFPNGGDAELRLPPETEGLKTQYTYAGRTYHTGLVAGAGVYLRHTWGVVPGYLAHPQPATTAYAWTYVYSPRERTVGALIELQNYSRSEVDLPPRPGRWDRKGSRLYVNDTEVLPPEWADEGPHIGLETPLGNENLTARQPTPIHLRRGWNKVLFKLPYNPEGGVRLVKWMFTFVLTDPDGRDALDDVVYSPDRLLPTH